MNYSSTSNLARGTNLDFQRIEPANRTVSISRLSPITVFFAESFVEFGRSGTSVQSMGRQLYIWEDIYKGHRKMKIRLIQKCDARNFTPFLVVSLCLKYSVYFNL